MEREDLQPERVSLHYTYLTPVTPGHRCRESDRERKYSGRGRQQGQLGFLGKVSKSLFGRPKQLFVGSIRHMLQASPVTAPYMVLVPSNVCTLSPVVTPLTHSTITLPHGAATLLYGMNESHREKFESGSGSKLGGVVKHPAGEVA